ncbi:MAG: efflux RND transporter periplasmic adaptor subunit [Rhizobiaceae bacterium]|nr:efflux RND transporter periplasmic adaptor subunit [Rhizobiaceae bacterium]
MPRPIGYIVAGLFVAGLTLQTTSALAGEYVVEPTTMTEMKAVFGQVKSRIVVPGRARIGGTVQEVLAREGDEVQEGQVVATIVDEKLALRLNAANASIEALNSQLQNARVQLERAQQLRSTGAGSQATLDQARTQFEVISNQVAAAVADRAVIEQSEKEGSVLAPATGRVLTVPVTLGSVIMAGEEVVRIAPGPYYLRLSLPERHAGQIVQGAQVSVGARGITQPGDGNADAQQGRIVHVYPEISDGRIIADVQIEGVGDYFVNERTLVSIPVGKRTVLAVPVEAVRTLNGVDYVRVTTAGGEIDVAVIPGEKFRHEGKDRVEILSGLQAGDRAMLP